MSTHAGRLRTIAEACEYVTLKQGGFTTFMTGTLTPEARARINRHKAEAGEEQPVRAFREGGRRLDAAQPAGPWSEVSCPWESSVQREASRFFDAVQRMVKRGCVPEYFRGAEQDKNMTPWVPITRNREGWRLMDAWYCLNPRQDDETGADFTPVMHAKGAVSPGRQLSYLWVTENPENAAGERNPHVHMMVRWSVPFSVFPCWARRMERLWGNGYLHLEKLRTRAAAGYYIAKAAG